MYKRIQDSAKLPIVTICAPSVKQPKEFGKSMSSGVYGGISAGKKEFFYKIFIEKNIDTSTVWD